MGRSPHLSAWPSCRVTMRLKHPPRLHEGGGGERTQPKVISECFANPQMFFFGSYFLILQSAD